VTLTAALRVIRHFVPHPFGVALQAIYDAARRGLPSLRPGLHIHVQSFGRFDEIVDLVEKASALTLPDLGRNRPSIRCYIPVAIRDLISRIPTPPTLQTLLSWRQRRRAALRGV
jgi:hypothetical protein